MAKVNNVITMMENDIISLSTRRAIQEIADDLAAQIRMETAKSIGTSTAKITKLMERVLKENRRDKIRESFHYAWFDSDSMQYVASPHMAFRFSNYIPMEPAPDNFQPANVIKTLFDGAINREFDVVELPSAAELKAYIKINKATYGRKWNYMYDFGDNKPAANANYLMDIMSVFPDMTEMAFKKTDILSTLYGCSKYGEVILLPIRKMTAAKTSDRENRGNQE